MSTIREPLTTFARSLEKTERQLNEVVDLVRKKNDSIQSLRPQHDLPAIPLPKQKKDFNRSCNVVSWLRGEMEKRNSSLPLEGPRYQQLPNGVDDSRISSDAQRRLEMFHLDTEYGQFKWDKEMVRKPRECAAIFREAIQVAELSVFCQTAGLWRIDMLLKTKVKSKMRTFGKSDRAEAEHNGVDSHIPTRQPSVAPNMETVRAGNQVMTEGIQQLTPFDQSNLDTLTNVNSNPVRDPAPENLGAGRSADATRNAVSLVTSLQNASRSFQQSSYRSPFRQDILYGQNGTTSRDGNLPTSENNFSAFVNRITHNLAREAVLVSSHYASNRRAGDRREETTVEATRKTTTGVRRRGRGARRARASRS